MHRVQAERTDKLVGALGLNEDRLGPVTAGDAGHDNVHAFRQEGAFTLAELVVPQRRRPLDEGVLRTGEWFA
jgi:hypothetical protein